MKHSSLYLKNITEGTSRRSACNSEDFHWTDGSSSSKRKQSDAGRGGCFKAKTSRPHVPMAAINSLLYLDPRRSRSSKRANKSSSL